jgi:hypothetical protein
MKVIPFRAWLLTDGPVQGHDQDHRTLGSFASSIFGGAAIAFQGKARIVIFVRNFSRCLQPSKILSAEQGESAI